MFDHAYVIRMQYTCGFKIRNFLPTRTNVPEATCIYLSKHEQTLIVVQNYPLLFQIYFEMMPKQISFGWDTVRAIKTRCIVHQQTTMATPDELKNHFLRANGHILVHTKRVLWRKNRRLTNVQQYARKLLLGLNFDL